MAEQEFLNYASGDEENVSVPRKFRAGRNTSDVELAYITPEEAGILATLRPGSPHRGPMEVPSYDDIDASGRYSGSEALDYGGGSKAFGSSSVTGQGLAAAGQHPDPKMNEIAAFNKSQWNQRFKPSNQRTGQGGQGFFGSLFGGGIRNFLSGLGDKLRTVDGQVMPQSYFSEEEREKRRALRGIETIMNRKNPVTNRTNKRLGQLYDTAYGVGQGDRNFFGGADIGKSPAMLQANELGLYNERINAGDAGVQVGADQNLRGNNELVDVDKVQEMINNSYDRNVTSLPVDDDVMQRFSFADLGINPNATNNFNTQVAEAINYNKLPEASQTYEGDYPVGFSKSSNYGGNKYTGTTKGDFFNALQEGTFGMQTEPIFNKNINALFEGVADDEIGTGWTDDAKPTFIRQGTGFDESGYIDVPRKDLKNWQSPEGFWRSAQGGRVGYNTGGRVGILAAF